MGETPGKKGEERRDEKKKRRGRLSREKKSPSAKGLEGTKKGVRAVRKNPCRQARKQY